MLINTIEETQKREGEQKINKFFRWMQIIPEIEVHFRVIMQCRQVGVKINNHYDSNGGAFVRYMRVVEG